MADNIVDWENVVMTINGKQVAGTIQVSYDMAYQEANDDEDDEVETEVMLHAQAIFNATMRGKASKLAEHTEATYDLPRPNHDDPYNGAHRGADFILSCMWDQADPETSCSYVCDGCGKHNPPGALIFANDDGSASEHTVDSLLGHCGPLKPAADDQGLATVREHAVREARAFVAELRALTDGCKPPPVLAVTKTTSGEVTIPAEQAKGLQDFIASLDPAKTDTLQHPDDQVDAAAQALAWWNKRLGAAAPAPLEFSRSALATPNLKLPEGSNVRLFGRAEVAPSDRHDIIADGVVIDGMVQLERVAARVDQVCFVDCLWVIDPTGLSLTRDIPYTRLLPYQAMVITA